MKTNFPARPFEKLFAMPLGNGLTRPQAVRGSGIRMVNMGELFANPRIGDIPMERVQVSEAEQENYLLESGDLLFARQSLVLSGAGKCSIFLGASEPITYEGHIIRARLDKAVASPGFYYYFFNSQHGRNAIESIVEQVAAAGIRGSDLAKLQVPYPPPDEQRAIAHILGTLDDKIELNRKMNETLEAIARALFKSWFVDFDHVRAKMQTSEVSKDFGSLDAETAALFPDAFEDSELGEIPRGWQVKSLDEIADFLNGLALQNFPPEGEEYLPVIKIAELRRGNTEGSDKASAKIAPEYIAHDGDVIFSWSGSLEVRVWCGGKGALNQHLFKVTSKDFPKWFYYQWVLHHLPDFQFIAAGKATTMGHIQRHHLGEAKVLVPSFELLRMMDQVASPLLDRTISNAVQSRTLAALRDALLPKLISGEVRVRDMEF